MRRRLGRRRTATSSLSIDAHALLDRHGRHGSTGLVLHLAQLDDPHDVIAGSEADREPPPEDVELLDGEDRLVRRRVEATRVRHPVEERLVLAEAPEVRRRLLAEGGELGLEAAHLGPTPCEKPSAVRAIEDAELSALLLPTRAEVRPLDDGALPLEYLLSSACCMSEVGSLALITEAHVPHPECERERRLSLTRLHHSSHGRLAVPVE